MFHSFYFFLKKTFVFRVKYFHRREASYFLARRRPIRSCTNTCTRENLSTSPGGVPFPLNAEPRTKKFQPLNSTSNEKFFCHARETTPVLGIMRKVALSFARWREKFDRSGRPWWKPVNGPHNLRGVKVQETFLPSCMKTSKQTRKLTAAGS